MIEYLLVNYSGAELRAYVGMQNQRSVALLTALAMVSLLSAFVTLRNH
jgi:hypothetical protein